MKHELRFGGLPEDVLVTTRGTATVAGLDAVVSDLLADRRYLPGLLVLFDHSQLDWSALQPEDLLRRLHRALKGADLLGPRRIAVVSADRRLWRQAVHPEEPVWRAFADVDEARRWLLEATSRPRNAAA
jgi:hypothetical protein